MKQAEPIIHCSDRVAVLRQRVANARFDHE
jgi:hypothetical protein